ncbi:MAG: alpha/beta hydrolase [Maribacter sp.]|nr:alpha/beta hydrolase [Maribacter sp.]
MLLEQNRAYDSESYLEFRCTFRLQDGREIYQILSYCVNRIRAGAANGPVPGEQPPEPPPPPAGDEQVFHIEIKPSFVRVPVFFATDRKDTQSSDPNARFGRDLAAPFHINYGICEVSIPFTHEVGEIENPSIWRLEFTENPNRHIVLQKIKLLDSENYFKVLAATIKQTAKKRTFLFVHGYNVSFADAAKRTAQIKYDLNFSGAAVFYSWPSQASTTAYTVDETNIEWAETNMKHFLADYLSKSEAEEIYLIAHSMGNRGLTNALISLVSEQPELNKKIKEIILAAPDIDVGIFKRDIAPQMVSKIKKPITLYVSSDDVALKASREVHGRPRAGDSAKGITLVQGIETIDASNIDTSFLGHSYFAETKTILSDIYNLINTGKRASQRTQLELVRLGNGSYWKVKK